MRFTFIFLLFTSSAFAESNLNHVNQTNDIFNNDEVIKFINNYDNSNSLIIKKVFEDLSPKQNSNKIESENTQITKNVPEDLNLNQNSNKIESESIQKLINNDGVMFSADSVTLDRNQNTLTAIGNVSIVFNNINLSSDKIIYYKSLNEIHAEGWVSLGEKEGGFHNGEKLIIKNSLSNIFMENIYSKLSDGSQMTARNLFIKNKNLAVYEGTKYTPCNCKLENKEIPLWHFSARTTKINKKTHTVHHDGVTMHLFNLPILYTPTFAHPDWTVKRKSGFLTPNISIGKDTGITIKQPYFINKSQSQDFTITPIVFSKTGILTNVEYRNVKKSSNLKANFIGGKVDTVNNKDEEVISGFINYQARMKDNWKTNIVLQDSSEDSFLRKYKLTEDTILKSSFSSEKFANDSYASIELYKIGSLSRETENNNSPLVLPSIKYEKEFTLPYNNSFGKVQMSVLDLKDDEGYDLSRYSNTISTQRNFLLSKGLGFLEASFSANLYDISKSKDADTKIGNINAFNSYLSFGWEDFIPTRILNNQAIIKPQIQTVLINGSDHVNVIPNRDALDYRLDETNLFLPHRPQGNDLVLPGGRFDYGITSFINNKNSLDLAGFFGQSLKLWGNNESEFQSSNPNKADISESDYIARFAVQNSNNFSTDWSARLDPRTFEIYESITTVSQNLGSFDLSASHASLSDGYIKGANGAENLNFKFSSKITNDWSLSGLQNYNLYNGDVKLLKTEYGISYSGSLQNCMVIELKYERESKTDPSIAPITEVGLIFQFKYLGDIIETL